MALSSSSALLPPPGWMVSGFAFFAHHFMRWWMRRNAKISSHLQTIKIFFLVTFLFTNQASTLSLARCTRALSAFWMPLKLLDLPTARPPRALSLPTAVSSAKLFIASLPEFICVSARCGRINVPFCYHFFFFLSVCVGLGLRAPKCEMHGRLKI
jgi:hypothetical protein